jgi:hypothetical protein
LPRHLQNLRVRSEPLKRPLATLATVEMGEHLGLVLAFEPAFEMIAKGFVTKAIGGHGLLHGSSAPSAHLSQVQQINVVLIKLRNGRLHAA